ncbi:MAG: sulfur carrier protein ThiS [Fusobacteria bacterium]|nr:sulfur carrier protein ThiS [Fusobacteriota bacterium]
MAVTINGLIEKNVIGKTIEELINMKKLEKKSLIVEYNYNILKKENWDSTIIDDKDNIELLNFVGGG